MDKKTPIIKYTPTYRKIGSFAGKSTGLNNPAFTTTIPSFKRRVSTLQRDHDPLRDAAPEAAEKALRFISGGDKLGSSIVSGARNNISKFNRSILPPQKTYTENLIQNISTSTIGAPPIFAQDSQEKGKTKSGDYNLDFISNFVKFFGSKKTEKRLKKSLKLLRNTLVDTFEIAKLLRVAIKQIAKQLKGLSMQGGGGGLLGGLLSGLVGGVGSLGLGALGLGAGGLLSRRNKGGQRVPPGRKPRTPKVTQSAAQASKFGKLGKIAALVGLGSAVAGSTSQFISGDENNRMMMGLGELKKFDTILDRFDRAIESLMRDKNQKNKKRSSGGSSGGGVSVPTSSGSTGGSFGGGSIPSYTGSAPVAEIEQDTEFVQEVQKLAEETGAKPSELMALYQAESGLDPTAINPNNNAATGLFQLMFSPGEKRYGKTQEEFASMSRADQVRAHREYLKDTGFFAGDQRGIGAVKVANIAPAFLGESMNTPMYRKGTAAYENNAAVDQVYGNNDGVIDGNDYAAFVNAVGNPSQFSQFDTGATTPTVVPAQRSEQTQRSVTAPSPTPTRQSISIVPFSTGGQQNIQPTQSSPKPMNLSGSGNNGPKITFHSSKNSDSYSGLYAKMIYNIVDG